MYYREETLFEQYPLELTDTYKGRGAVFAMTDIGRVYLKEYSGSAVKAEFLAKLLECVNEQGIHTETVVRTTEGECLAKDPDGCCVPMRNIPESFGRSEIIPEGGKTRANLKKSS